MWTDPAGRAASSPTSRPTRPTRWRASATTTLIRTCGTARPCSRTARRLPRPGERPWPTARPAGTRRRLASPAGARPFLDDRRVQADIDFDETARPPRPKAIDLKKTQQRVQPQVPHLRTHRVVALASGGAAELGEAHKRDVAAGPTGRLLRCPTRSPASEAQPRHPPKSWIPHLQHVEMTGGEPMFSPENREGHRF